MSGYVVNQANDYTGKLVVVVYKTPGHDGSRNLIGVCGEITSTGVLILSEGSSSLVPWTNVHRMIHTTDPELPHNVSIVDIQGRIVCPASPEEEPISDDDDDMC